MDLDRERANILREIESVGEVLASFWATHLNVPNLFVCYMIVSGWVVKVDAVVTSSERGHRLPEPALVIDDPDGRFSDQEAAEDEVPIQFVELNKRFCGWLWYSYGKIARGEFFQAARSIDFTRENALLPCILFLRDLPQDGHRRVETHLSTIELDQLLLSYPTKLERNELLRALQALTQQFLSVQERLADRLAQDPRVADLAQVLSIIRTREASLARQPRRDSD